MTPEGLTAPRRVRPGDTVAVVSPSAGAIGWWPHRAERGRLYLESLGLKVKAMPNAARDEGWASAPAEARAEDLHTAFSDDEVSVVLASIGGNHSNQVLPYLDLDLIARNPKIFQGYSDMTVLHWAFIVHCGLSTFYGPALTLGLAEFPRVLDYSDRYLRAAWFGDEPLRYEPAAEWTEEFLDFNLRDDLRRARSMSPNSGWIVVRAGAARGPLLGGCLETICWHLKGSPEWVDPAGAVLFLETSEEAPSPGHVDAYLTDLENLGVFDSAAALIVGRPANYSREANHQFLRVVAERTEDAGIPVLANFDCGHTDPMATLPLGAVVNIDARARLVETLGPPTSI